MVRLLCEIPTEWSLSDEFNCPMTAICLSVWVSDCFFKQGEWCFALADYQQAEEMMSPLDPAVRLRLAVLHNTLGSFDFQQGSEVHKHIPGGAALWLLLSFVSFACLLNSSDWFRLRVKS